MKTRILRFLRPRSSYGGGAVAWTWPWRSASNNSRSPADRLPPASIDSRFCSTLNGGMRLRQTDADMLQSTGNLLRQIATDSSARTVGRAGHVLGRRHRRCVGGGRASARERTRRARSDGSGSLVHRDHTDTSDAAGAVACTPACGIGGRCRWQIEKREAGLMALAAPVRVHPRPIVARFDCLALE